MANLHTENTEVKQYHDTGNVFNTGPGGARKETLLKKIAGFQLVEKFNSFYGTRRFITTFTRARHLSLS